MGHGATYKFLDAAVAANGVFPGALEASAVTIPGAANPISGRDIIVQDMTIDGHFAGPPGRFCSQLAGHVVQPTDVVLVASENTCVFTKVVLGEPAAAALRRDFADGCSPP